MAPFLIYFIKLDSQVQTSSSTPFRGSAHGPMQGEVSPYDPLFSAHPASLSQRQSLCGTQNNPPRIDLLKQLYFLHRYGARFCSKGRKMTLLSDAARTPIKRKSAQQYFKSSGTSFKASGVRGMKEKIKHLILKGDGNDHGSAPLGPPQKLMTCLICPQGRLILLQNRHFRHPWRSGTKANRQGSKFPLEPLT